MRKLLLVAGVPIDLLDMAGALDRIEQMVRGGRATGEVHQIATVNTDFVVKAQFDPELRYLLQRADLLTADGMPLVWAARLLGAPLKGRVTGADLVPALSQRAAERGFSIFFLGGAEGVAAKAAELLKKEYPQLIIAGAYSPPFSSVLEMDTSFLEEIRSGHPDILLVAFGNPKQEKWIGMYGRSLGAPVQIGVGGSFDFITGRTRRAPEWMQRNGLEWLFRLLQEPRRLFRRYVVDLVIFSIFFLRQILALRISSGASQQTNPPDLDIVQGKAVLNMPACLTINSLADLYPVTQKALQASPHILANMAQVERIDSAAWGALLELGKQAAACGGELSLAAVPSRIRQTLPLLRLEHTFPIYADSDSYLSEYSPQRTGTHLLQHRQITFPPEEQGWTVLKTARVLDASTAPGFIDTAANALASNPFLICDFSETFFLASAGIAALVQLRSLASSLNGEMRITNCSKDVLQVLKLARFDQGLAANNRFKQAASQPL